jgi:hypothetical protein
VDESCIGVGVVEDTSRVLATVLLDSLANWMLSGARMIVRLTLTGWTWFARCNLGTRCANCNTPLREASVCLKVRAH